MLQPQSKAPRVVTEIPPGFMLLYSPFIIIWLSYPINHRDWQRAYLLSFIYLNFVFELKIRPNLDAKSFIWLGSTGRARSRQSRRRSMDEKGQPSNPSDTRLTTKCAEVVYVIFERIIKVLLPKDRSKYCYFTSFVQKRRQMRTFCHKAQFWKRWQLPASQLKPR